MNLALQVIRAPAVSGRRAAVVNLSSELMKGLHKSLTGLPLVIAFVTCIASSAQATVFYSIDTISSSTSATDLFPTANLIAGPGVGFDADMPHDQIFGGLSSTWVTAAPGGFPADYIAVAGTPVLTLDLGQDRSLSEISVWGYNPSNANGVSEFSLRFATGAEGASGFGASIAFNPTFFPVNDNVMRQSFLFGPTVFARFVEFTALDNFFISPGDGSGGQAPGGDRVGLGEIAFAAPQPVPEPSTVALLGITLAGLVLFRPRHWIEHPKHTRPPRRAYSVRGTVPDDGGMGRFSTMFRTDKAMILVGLVLACSPTGANAGPLMIDFNSTTQDGGPHNQAGYQAYDAGHEVAADFVTQSYSAFGTTVSVTPAWPNTTDNRVQQMIDRGAGNDANWDNTAGDLDLVTDFLGIDTRTGNGGNGNWDGVDGTPTYMTLTLSGLNAATYDWTSYHHDTEHLHGAFAAELSLDGGFSFTQLADGYMSDSTPGGNPDSALDGFPGPQFGPDADSLLSTYTTTFNADGTSDVVFRFAPYSNTAIHRQVWGINGFVLHQVPEPSTVTLVLISGVALLRRRRG